MEKPPVAGFRLARYSQGSVVTLKVAFSHGSLLNIFLLSQRRTRVFEDDRIRACFLGNFLRDVFLPARGFSRDPSRHDDDFFSNDIL